MPRNGSGSYALPAGNPVVTGTTIDSTVQNNTTSDIATALTNSLAKDGQTTPTANLPMGGFKLTGLASGSARTDSASLANLQDGTGIYVSTVGGTADVITLTPSPAITAYAAGQAFSFIASGANTTNVTVNVSGLGAKAITKLGTNALVANDIPSGSLINVKYDGTQFQLVAGGSLSAALSNTFTPALTFVTPGNLSVSYTTQQGSYYKIGRMVFVKGNIITSSFTHTTASGNLQITGFPFAAETNANNLSRIDIQGWQGITSANFTQMSLRLDSAATTATGVKNGSAQNTSTLAAGDMPTGGTVVLQFSGCYLAAS